MINSQDILKQVREYRPTSNPSTIEGFIGSTLHLDFQNEIVARIEQMRDWNEECKSNEYLETRGGIKAMRLVMDIFDDLLRARITDLESEETEEIEND